MWLSLKNALFIKSSFFDLKEWDKFGKIKFKNLKQLYTEQKINIIL